MTNLTSPAASTVLGSPKSNNMADVIDALKRLERIGSENSKTTEKLLAAAAELGKKIVAQYAVQPGENISIELYATQPAATQPDEIESYLGPPLFDYRIADRELFRVDPKPKAIGKTWVHVAENRDAALAFSKDVANGLLERIAEDLEKRTAAVASGADVLIAATASQPPTKPPFQY